ncbi:hypothetical protein WJ96_04780 [Burkholderia ubonensis]|uniref:DUF2274 domain-containing protein n=1 Tax=Burkholderia ubonensis TaxID=101571 RepID=A0AAW3MVC0_9BURK|nr:DUF2274 domain-containing protein [Burkholderia ubonensis]KVP75083.1 hypothetical protein WJ93_06620 [Burkholderia ubonensis]KVP96544.1 hypothetical protein WJ97_11705 [Burkholderia ubonensis]KVP97888.1 hypothetical protein WJ96_04780 [Burkholderia ubonensis]KVZ92585.1 hypothetical protein WL25_16435 [Burkholderia ubonensis]
MKLTRIPGHEQTVKQSFALKQSTMTQLQQYQEFYLAETKAENVYVKDLVEQMLLDFMREDKDFQRFVKQKDTPAAPVAASTQSSVNHSFGGFERRTDGDAPSV